MIKLIAYNRLCVFIFLIMACNSTTIAQEYVIEKIANSINTDNYNEIAPIISMDGSTLFFTRTGSPDYNKMLLDNGVDISNTLSETAYNQFLSEAYTAIAGADIPYAPNSDLNQDIWIAYSINSDFDHVIHPSAPLNNALPNSICSLTPNPDDFVVINQFPKSGGMQKGFSIVSKTDTGWTFPTPINIENYYTRKTGLSMTLSADGQVMILSLDREDTHGDNDLYICQNLGDNQWSAPVNMGGQINSKYREATPHLSPDLQKLFYCSNRPDSKGGMDIYYVERQGNDWSHWSTPRHFVAPINSIADDSQPYFNYATGQLYFTSKREGSSDIFRVKIAPPRSLEVTIAGRIINTRTNQPMKADVAWRGATRDTSAHPINCDNGYFTFTIKQGDDINLWASKDKFIGQSQVLPLANNRAYSKPLEVTLLMDPVENGAYISLNPIYFERTKANILEKSYKEVDKLLAVLQQYPDMHIIVEGHTDNNGDAAGLVKLSEERAAAVKEYLVQRQILPNRVDVTGYGGTRPVTGNSSEDTRSLNRRVEVKITKIAQ